MPATGLESPVLLLELNEILCYAAREISLQLQNCVQARMSLSTDYGPPIRAFFKHIQKFWHKKLGLPKVVRYLGVFLVVLSIHSLVMGIPKGQLVSKCPIGVFKSSKKPTKFFPRFLPWNFIRAGRAKIL